MFADLTFLSPWVLGALAALPVLWWMLRVMPPRPRTVRFPAFFLLKEIRTDLKAAAYTPWWLLLLRALAVALFILAFAEPVLHRSQDLPGGRGEEVLAVVDNGWASAAGWAARQAKLKEFLQRARRGGRTVIFLPTAPAAEDGQVRSYGPMAAEEAEAWAERLKPQPWPAAGAEVAALAQKTISERKISYAAFFSDGLAAEPELLKLMQAVVTDEEVNNPYVLRQAERKPGRLDLSLERLHPAPQARPLKLLAYTDEGSVIDELKLEFPAGETRHAFSWDMLPEVRNKTARISLRGPEMASATLMTGASWRQHPVGIIAGAGQKDSRNFLSEVYYLRRALEAGSKISVDRAEALLKLPLSAVILPDSAPLTAAEKVALLDWVQQGGFLIRFGGPSLAGNSEDALLPVPLRHGQRAMEGALTWEKPVALGAIPEQSPLSGLEVPADVTVARQVLADPAPEVFEKTWLQLEDGTPLLTGGRMGKGTLALVHTTAGPEWSNFCYSGLYVEALQRMIALSNGISGYKPQAALPPLLLLDGFGRPGAPDARTLAVPLRAEQEFEPSPRSPPGLYGDSREFAAFNLGDHLPPLAALKGIPPEAATETYQKAGETGFRTPLIQAALLLLLVDTLLTFWLRGVAAFAAALFVLLAAAPGASLAAEAEQDLVSGVYLAYIETGDAEIDRISYDGLAGLGEVINARTTVKVRGISALNPDRDPLGYYPVIYWPMSSGQLALTAAAARNIQDYLAQGGMILFDTRDRQFGAAEGGSAALGTRRLRKLVRDIDFPELVPVPADHILTRSFYLLDEFPGRYAGGKLWVEKEPSPRHDGVTSVVIGDNDWASAWSKDEGDRARYMVEPGGEAQRETAYRFGVNLLMAALTGNYKADQVHVPYILERLGQ